MDSPGRATTFHRSLTCQSVKNFPELSPFARKMRLRKQLCASAVVLCAVGIVSVAVAIVARSSAGLAVLLPVAIDLAIRITTGTIAISITVITGSASVLAIALSVAARSAIAASVWHN